MLQGLLDHQSFHRNTIKLLSFSNQTSRPLVGTNTVVTYVKERDAKCLTFARGRILANLITF